MELVPYSNADIGLTEAIECDPEVMRELGGPLERDRIPELHRRRLERNGEGDCWLKIVPEPGGPAAGTIGIWSATWQGTVIHETGWTLLVEFQGRGLASAALNLLLTRAREEPRFNSLHAFPSVTNAPSNGLCRKFDFQMKEECDLEFRGTPMRCNHWVVDL